MFKIQRGNEQVMAFTAHCKESFKSNNLFMNDTLLYPPAIKNLLKINEAFGAQTLACVKDLNLDVNILYVNGGAIALGHPLGASSFRIMGQLINELRTQKAKHGIESACIGGGQEIAVMVEIL